MHLMYRGIPYETNQPELTVQATESMGVYRGVPLTGKTFTLSYRSAANTQLTYRGVSYLR